MKREREWAGGYGGGCSFKWGPGEASLGVTPEWSRGSEAGGYLGKRVLAGSVREAEGTDNHANAHRVPRTYRDDPILIFTITL